MKKDADGIQVFCRPVEGSLFHEVKAVTFLHISLDDAVAFISDVSGYPEWISKCGEARLLEQVSPSESYSYTVVNAHWPVSDRDAVTRDVIMEAADRSAVTITSTSSPDYLPEQEGRVRVRTLNAKWEILPQGDGTVKVEFTGYSDPRGTLPAWIFNPFLPRQAYNSFKAMKKALEQRAESSKVKGERRD